MEGRAPAMNFLVAVLAGVTLALCIPQTIDASTTQHGPQSIEISGWIPYWREALGTADVLPHLSQLTEINPFGYTVKNDGSLYDALHVSDPAWQSLFAAAKAKGTKVIPTVMWSDGAKIDAILRDPVKRAAHVQAIAAMVAGSGFAGVDIDYEGKEAQTKDSFSLFLRDLKKALGNKQLDCTIEARTPVDSRYLGTAPADATTYANDLPSINKYCDRVRLMTYDQQSVDLRLGAVHDGTLYAPVSDPAWIQKVVTLMEKDIDKKKIVLGVATYGYEYDVTAYPDKTYSYDLLWSFNPGYALPIASSFKINPSRNSVGEIDFAYLPTSTPPVLKRAIMQAKQPSSGFTEGDRIGVKALSYAVSTGKSATFRLMWWSDAKAIADKAALAKQLGIAGVAVFKFDGGEDKALWSVLK